LPPALAEVTSNNEGSSRTVTKKSIILSPSAQLAKAIRNFITYLAKACIVSSCPLAEASGYLKS
jgi:hypothetical protein